MAVPSVDFTVEETSTALSYTIDDVVFVVGPPSTDGDGAAGTLVYGNTLADFDAATGESGDVYDFIEAVLDQVDVEIIYSPTVASPTTAQVKAALELSYNATLLPTVIHVAGSLTAPSDSTTANAHVTNMQTVAEKLACRGVANAAQDTVAKATTWGTNNGQKRIIGCFNQKVRGTSDYVMPAGFWLGAALKVAATQGRAWGINYADVGGISTLRHDLTPISSGLAGLDAVGVSSIVSDQGNEEIIGDEFKETAVGDPQRFWTIGRIVDHVERALTSYGHTLIGSTKSVDRQAAHLTDSLIPIVKAGELVSAVVLPDVSRTQGDTKYFIAEIGVLYATNVIDIKLRFAA